MVRRCFLAACLGLACFAAFGASAEAASLVPQFKVSAVADATTLRGKAALRVRSITIAGKSIGRFNALARCDRRTCKRLIGQGRYRKRTSRSRIVFSNVNWVLSRGDSITVAVNRRGRIGRYVTLSRRASGSEQLIVRRTGCLRKNFKKRRCPRNTTQPTAGAVVSVCRAGYESYTNVGGSLLAGGATMAANSCMASPNQKYVLRLHTNGELSLFGPKDYLLWSTRTGGQGSSELKVLNGLRLLKSQDGAQTWAVDTQNALLRGLEIQDDGNLVLKDTAGMNLWTSGTIGYNGNTHRATYGLNSGQVILPGEFIRSGNWKYHLILQGDGNLVLYPPSGPALWSSATNSATLLGMQGDGNLVLYNANKVAVWSTGTNGHTNAHLRVQDDGNIVVYNTAGQAVWSR